MKPDTIKGHLDLMLLSILSGGPNHGYAVIETLRDQSGSAFDLPEGTVYPALHRLEKAGLLSSSWSEASGRRRRIYRITSDGRKSLERQKVEWNRFSRAISGVLKKGKPWPNPV